MAITSEDFINWLKGYIEACEDNNQTHISISFLKEKIEQIKDKEFVKYINIDFFHKEKVPYHTICECNPSNGGNGICGCTIPNLMVDKFLWTK